MTLGLGTAAVVIPARGGSKRLPRKNVLPLRGLPLIAYTIAAARSASTVSRVFVSTDDDEIGNVSRAWHAEVIRRPPELATDHASIDDALVHALTQIRGLMAPPPELLIWLQPDVPIRQPGAIDRAIEMLRADRQLTGVATGYRVTQHPGWMKTMDADGYIEPLQREVTAFRQQELPALFLLDGAVVAFRAANLDRATSPGVHVYLGPRVKLLLQDLPMYSLNIDTATEFDLADMYLTRYPERKPAG